MKIIGTFKLISVSEIGYALPCNNNTMITSYGARDTILKSSSLYEHETKEEVHIQKNRKINHLKMHFHILWLCNCYLIVILYVSPIQNMQECLIPRQQHIFIHYEAEKEEKECKS